MGLAGPRRHLCYAHTCVVVDGCLRVCVIGCMGLNSPVYYNEGESSTAVDVVEEDDSEEEHRNVSSEKFWKARFLVSFVGRLCLTKSLP